MIKLVIFDLDGTLLNTINDLAVSVNHALKRFDYPEHSLEEYKELVGNGITRLVEQALPEDARDEEQVKRVRELFVAYYSAHKTDLTKPYPGIPELLEAMKHRGMILAVASNKFQEATRDLIRYYFKEGTFLLVLGQREGIPVKPDPAVVNEILSQADVSQEETLYIGDSSVDMQTAVNSGVKAVGVTWGFRSRQELKDNGASYIVNEPSEILGLLE